MGTIGFNQRKLTAAIVTSVIFMILLSCYYYIDKYITGVPFFILMLILFLLGITILINIIKGIVDLIKNRKLFCFPRCLPVLIYIIVPLLPFPDAEQFESKVLLRGCYEGTQNKAYILFRENHGFEIHATGAFFYSGWVTGTWRRNGDTLLLNYNKDKINRLLGKKVLIQDGYFKPVGSAEASKYPIPLFYVGYCKGGN